LASGTAATVKSAPTRATAIEWPESDLLKDFWKYPTDPVRS